MLSFPMPDGWELPPDAKPGQPFQAVGTFIADKDGKNIRFTEIDGRPLADGSDDDENKEDDNTDDEEAEGETEQPEMPDHMEEMANRARAAGLMK